MSKAVLNVNNILHDAKKKFYNFFVEERKMLQRPPGFELLIPRMRVTYPTH